MTSQATISAKAGSGLSGCDRTGNVPHPVQVLSTEGSKYQYNEHSGFLYRKFIAWFRAKYSLLRHLDLLGHGTCTGPKEVRQASTEHLPGTFARGGFRVR